jgi:hypothetical protein
MRIMQSTVMQQISYNVTQMRYDKNDGRGNETGTSVVIRKMCCVEYNYCPGGVRREIREKSCCIS